MSRVEAGGSAVASALQQLTLTDVLVLQVSKNRQSVPYQMSHKAHLFGPHHLLNQDIVRMASVCRFLIELIASKYDADNRSGLDGDNKRELLSYLISVIGTY